MASQPVEETHQISLAFDLSGILALATMTALSGSSIRDGEVSHSHSHEPVWAPFQPDRRLWLQPVRSISAHLGIGGS
jgi:hypothetical protein